MAADQIETQEGPSLRRALGRTTAMLLTAAMIIGTGLFAALGETAEKAGSGLPLSIIFGGLVILATGLSAASVGINQGTAPDHTLRRHRRDYLRGRGLSGRRPRRPVLEVANVFTLVWYIIVIFDALNLPKEKRLVWPVISWLALAGCLALFASLPIWALATGIATLVMVMGIRWLILHFNA